VLKLCVWWSMDCKSGQMAGIFFSCLSDENSLQTLGLFCILMHTSTKSLSGKWPIKRVA
jgi:hypothetical protein